MIYVCERTGCHFTFEASAVPEQCPDCGSTHFHPAAAMEVQQFQSEHPCRNLAAYIGNTASKR